MIIYERKKFLKGLIYTLIRHGYREVSGLPKTFLLMYICALRDFIFVDIKKITSISVR